MLPGKSGAVLKETAAMSAWNPFTFILPGHKIIPDGEDAAFQRICRGEGKFLTATIYNSISHILGRVPPLVSMCICRGG
jgi:hypothetical protein